MSKIEWTDKTWNPMTGCTKYSAGCENCYAEKMAKRLQAMGSPHYVAGFNFVMHYDALEKPLEWKKPCKIFVCSMSDIFHEQGDIDFLIDIFETMIKTPRHTYQILTKRTDKFEDIIPDIDSLFRDNMWLGVTVEGFDYTDRIDKLRGIHAAKTKFISFEPLLDDVGEIDLEDIDWVIVGGESGSNARPMREEWVINIRDQCIAQNVPFLFKQWGGKNKKKAGRLLEGREWNEYPATRLDDRENIGYTLPLLWSNKQSPKEVQRLKEEEELEKLLNQKV